MEACVYKARRTANGAIEVDVKVATSLDELGALARDGWANTDMDARAALEGAEQAAVVSESESEPEPEPEPSESDTATKAKPSKPAATKSAAKKK